MKKIVFILIALLMIAVTVNAERMEGLLTPDPAESRAWQSVESQYDGTMESSESYVEYWAPSGFRSNDPTFFAFGWFVHRSLLREYNKFDIYYFRWSNSREEWYLYLDHPVEAHKLFFVEGKDKAVVLEDYKRYGEPFNSNVNRSNGRYTIVSNYRRNDQSVLTVTYYSLFEAGDNHFVRRAVN